ncbi:tripartite tricarboxylate transporter substrate binding protein [Pigmentiphaga sp. H8]|uniref:Bug family tripartite tricarboxylate transporter substrate binding protein n=1 Tax=Pigmentiphaga sp. H8 TaxID=2488560 RepID=UPI001375C276|nr:tripartite tricarboxylate transporter substrate binding protein [Pigmentiphaga sp. H8]
MIGLTRLAILALGTLLIVAWTPPAARAADIYPSKPISLILPFGAGNGSDLSSRRLATQLGKILGQQIVVENRPGAGGVGAVKQVTSAPADGYTLMLAGAGMPISQALFNPPPYDMLKSFVPVSAISSNDVAFLVKASSRYATLDDFIREAKERKKGLMVGVSLLGTTQHMAAELFKLHTHTDFTIVPFRTASMLTTALVGENIDLAFEFVAPTLPMLNSGQLRALAVSSAQRSPVLPQVPTVAEQGIPDYAVSSWGMIVAPVNTPAPIVKRLNTEIQNVLQDPEFIRQLQGSGTRVLGGTTDQARQLMESEIVRWKKVIDTAGIALQ